ncbi:MAG: Hsp20/alpha crystallin family protein [Bacteroidales bacterium]|jgi:HSP20 family protein|nr:Hsp20/alpha crystallin family protein [Bacteroidales bacterium]HOI31632.1 Hsp20/alpha crystallin family protein [Bacteroidales bacterium]
MKLTRFSNNLIPAFPSLIDRFFEGDLMDWNNWNFTGSDSTLPAVNVKENDDEITIEVAAPGFKKDDFKLNFDNGRLTISSEKEEKFEEKEGEKITRLEFSYSSFQRSFSMPETVVNAEKITAKYNDGILRLTLPKREEVKPKPVKHIKIS